MKEEIKMDKPRVSIIIPIYNPLLNQLEVSLQSIKDQTYTNYECLLVDDGSEESVFKFCSDFILEDKRFKILRHSMNLGSSVAMNTGLRVAQGEYIARMDADDICHINRIFEQVKYLEINHHVHVVGSSVIQFWDSTLDSGNIVIDYPLNDSEIKNRMFFINPIAHPTVMFRKSFLVIGGNYNCNLRTCEDSDLWLRWMNRGAIFANLKYPLLYYRNSGEKIRDRDHWLRAIKVHLDNFRSDRLLRRLSGIFMISVWCVIPHRIKKLIYRDVKSHVRHHKLFG